MTYLVALRKELMEQWRTYRLLTVWVILLVMGLASPLLAKLTPDLLRLLPGGEAIALIVPPPTIADAVAQYVKNLSQFGVILALLLGMGAVVQEKERGTAALMLSKPMSRGAFLAAKWTALSANFLGGLVLAGLAAYYYTSLLFGAPNVGGWLALNGLTALFFWVYVSVALLASTVARSQAMAGGLAFGGLVILGGLGSLPAIGDYSPNRLLSWGTALALNMGGSAWPAALVSILLISGCLVAAWLILERQEL